MKKILTLILAAMLLSGSIVLETAQAFTFEVGDYNFVMTGNSYFGSNATSTELIGVYNVAAINDSNGNEVWSAGDDDKYLNVFFGGLSVTVPFDPTDDNDGVGYFSNGYAKIYESSQEIDFGAISLPSILGLNPPFPGNISGSDTLLLDLMFSDKVFSPYTFEATVKDPSTSPEDLTGLTLDTVGYLDIINPYTGSTYWSYLFDSDEMKGDADFRFRGGADYFATLYSDPNDLNSQKWDMYKSLLAQVDGTAVPEPSTILLLGAGLLGLASQARARRRS